ncbi:MAG: hypothetical protein PUG48_01570 [Clostridia bacterium]|nr:hypothetical protein [Clostridia bacterium]
MNKKILLSSFISACMLCCVIPFAAMTFVHNDEEIGNERQTDLPSLTQEDGKINKEYFEQLGNYFSAHYAFRPEIISLDAEIQSKVFGTSNLDSVIVGKNDWLYYSSTLDNYLGRNLMSERALFNTRHNLEITQEYLKENNIEFLFTIAPNKNTVYPENMPFYYSVKESQESNMKNFVSELNDKSLNYCDLLTPIKNSDEVLYLKQDSHWDNKGALIAYNKILDQLGKEHNTYENAAVTRKKNFYGDLGKMIYPSVQQPEYNYEYDINKTYEYVTPTKSVEEPIISTKNNNASGNLYMYRDSFGNALLPYFANAYNSAYFTKAFPINLALDTKIQKSDTVIFEIAERNLIWFAQSPPVLPSKETDVPDNIKKADGNFKVNAEISQVNMQYVSITGSVDSSLCSDDSEFILVVSDKSGKKRAFEAFTTSDEDSDYCFQAYIPEQDIDSENLSISVAVKNNNEFLLTESQNVSIQKNEVD